MRKLVLGLAVVMLAFTGCKKDSDCPENNTVAPAAEEQQVKDYLAANSINATKYKSGMYYVILTPGSGGSPSACSTVQVSYSGKLTNGTEFDKSANQVFSLQGLIAGWIQGIPLVQRGGSIRLFIPPSLGYGSQPVKDDNGNTLIPGGSVLIFDINLVTFQ
jgi:FKBP-type peptidyl-prolyl cis-trans isomerase FkpA